MSGGVNRLASELLRAANVTNGPAAEEVERMASDAVEAITKSHQATNIIPIPGTHALMYVRTVAAGAYRGPTDERRRALLHAAEMIRDPSVVIDSVTVINIRRSEPKPATSFEATDDWERDASGTPAPSESEKIRCSRGAAAGAQIRSARKGTCEVCENDKADVNVFFSS